MSGEEMQKPAEQQRESAPAADELETLRKSLEEQTAKAETHLNNWKRAQADLENFRKKVEQGKQETTTFANAMLVSGLLPILDDLERALSTIDTSLAGLTWVEGLKLVYRKLLSTLEGQGLAAIETEGEAFDPRHHEAIMHVPGEEGKVVGELQKGYLFRDRVIRPALVKVGNGQPAGSDEAAEGRPNDRTANP